MDCSIPDLASGGLIGTSEKLPHVVKLFLERPTDNDNIIQLQQAVFVRPHMTESISLSNVAGPLQRQKSRTFNCHTPGLVENAVFSLMLGCRATCQSHSGRGRDALCYGERI